MSDKMMTLKDVAELVRKDADRFINFRSIAESAQMQRAVIAIEDAMRIMERAAILLPQTHEACALDLRKRIGQ